MSDVVIVAVAGGGLASVLADIRTRRVPNALTFGIASAGVLLAALDWSGVGRWGAVAGFMLGFALMLPGHLLGATGAGDVKMFAATGTLLGPQGIAVAFLYTAIAGGVLALIVAARRRRLGGSLARTARLVGTAGGNVAEIEHPSADNRFAYAPAIAAGTLVAACGF